jgi:hypothetical protein
MFIFDEEKSILCVHAIHLSLILGTDKFKQLARLIIFFEYKSKIFGFILPAAVQLFVFITAVLDV